MPEHAPDTVTFTHARSVWVRGVNGEALGNFPQAFTHLGLIRAASVLDAALGTA